MKRLASTSEDDDRFAAIPTPELSDEAVVYIHRALENYLHLFEAHYNDQIWRYYQDREQNHAAPSSTQSGSEDNEPF